MLAHVRLSWQQRDGRTGLQHVGALPAPDEDGRTRTVNTRVINTNDEEFDATVLQSREPVLVDFWASWCPPCRQIAPVIEELAGEYRERLRVVKVDVDANPDIVSRYAIVSNPTLVFFKDGREARRLIGAWPKDRFVDVIEQVLAASAPLVP